MTAVGWDDRMTFKIHLNRCFGVGASQLSKINSFRAILYLIRMWMHLARAGDWGGGDDIIATEGDQRNVRQINFFTEFTDAAHTQSSKLFPIKPLNEIW